MAARVENAGKPGGRAGSRTPGPAASEETARTGAQERSPLGRAEETPAASPDPESESSAPTVPARFTRVPIPESPRSWVPRTAAWLCYLIGLLDIASALFPRVRHMGTLARYGHYVPGVLDPYAVVASLIVGVMLVTLAHALRRRKHRAWMGVIALLAVSIAAHGFRHDAFSGMALAGIVLVLLIVYRKEFYALSDPRSRWRAIFTFLVMLVGDFAIGMVLLYVRPAAISGRPSFNARFEQVVYGLAGISGPVGFRDDSYSDYVYFSLVALGAVTLLLAVYLFLRPAEPAARLTPAQEVRVRELLAKHGGRDSLGYFALRRDKSVIFSPTGKACVGYRVVSGVMLASGDPLGDPEAWPGAIKAFIERSDRYAWIPAVMGCSEQAGEIWRREAGMDALELGDEAVVEVAEFSLDGRPMRNVRQMVNRIERQGYACQVRRLAEIPPGEVALIRRLATDGRSTETERGFSMALGRFGDPADSECVVVTAVKDGEIRAVLDFVPWGKDGLSLDLMRRDRSADPGLNELMIVAALREAPRLGVARISLNFAVFRSALERGERIGAGPVLRRWRGLLVFLSRWFQIESLYRFNAKFRPNWEPRFVAFRQTRDLPRIAVAALEAEAFLVLPSLLRRGPKEPVDASSLGT
ncbi:MAG TPA: phosphatidylglycerol lysyltransferase domain-containing protein [Actinocrinis sp.]